ncbi:MAG: DUF1467 family protein [Rhodobiaceae bacterium]|nr:DUF1467 family protein [Rhodobiaceae bacterium]
MGIAATLAIYAIIWWLTLFVVLPFGIKTQDEEGVVSAGTAPSAPVHPQVWKKMAITTVLSAVIFGTIYGTIIATGLGLDDIPFLLTFEEDY